MRGCLLVLALLGASSGCGSDRVIRVDGSGFVIVDVPSSLPAYASQVRESGGRVFVGVLQGELRYRSSSDPFWIDDDVYLVHDYWEGEFRVVDTLGEAAIADTEEIFGLHTDFRVVDSCGDERHDVIVEGLERFSSEEWRLPTDAEPHVLFVMDVGWMLWSAPVDGSGIVDGSGTTSGMDSTLQELRVP